MLYDHHKGDITTKSNDIQHEYFMYPIISAFPFNHDNCLEIVAVKGKANRLTELSDKLLAIKASNMANL